MVITAAIAQGSMLQGSISRQYAHVLHQVQALQRVTENISILLPITQIDLH